MTFNINGVLLIGLLTVIGALIDRGDGTLIGLGIGLLIVLVVNIASIGRPYP